MPYKSGVEDTISYADAARVLIKGHFNIKNLIKFLEIKGILN